MYETIKKLCKEHGISITRLCEEITGSKGNLATWKKGNVRSEHLYQIAEKFDVSTDYLLGKSPTRHNTMSITGYEPENMIPIPIIDNVAAGYSAHAETNVIGYELVSTDKLRDGYEYAWLTVKGDSMTPLIMEGDMVLVRIQEEIDSGDLAVVIVDEEDGLVKRVKYSTSSVTLISDNPDYEPRVFRGEDMSRVRIWGKVTDLQRKLS